MSTTAIELLKCAWMKVVQEDLKSGNLFYEEDAQASLYYHFRSMAERDDYVIHVNALKHQPKIDRLSPDFRLTLSERSEWDASQEFEWPLDRCTQHAIAAIAQRTSEDRDRLVEQMTEIWDQSARFWLLLGDPNSPPQSFAVR